MRLPENLGGAGGFRAGMKAAYDAGFDRIWLVDDDVVPAPDCLTVLLGVDEACLLAVREDLAGRLVEKAALRFDLRNPLAIRPKTASVDSAYASRARPAAAGRDRERRLRGLPGPARGRRRRRAARRQLLHLLRRRRLRDPGAQGGLPASGRSATPCSCVSSSSTSSTRWTRGRATTCTATSSRCTSATARTGWCAPSPTRSRRRSPCSARCAAGGARPATCCAPSATRGPCGEIPTTPVQPT